MTEAEWQTDTSAGRLLEYARRLRGLTPGVRARKFRLVAVEIVRTFRLERDDGRVLPVVAAAECLCDAQASLRDVDDAIRVAGFPPRSDVWPNWGALVASLGAADPIDSARSAAGGTQDGSPEFRALHCAFIRDIFGNPFRPVTVDPGWLTSRVTALARGIYDERAFDRLPILADALQDAGCDHPDILTHCRGDGTHVRGCWVVDFVLGKE